VPRVTWNAPETRFFETGLDRGMLYPKKPVTVGALLSVNQAKNPRGVRVGSTSQEVMKNLTPNPKTSSPTLNNNYWTRTMGVAISGHPVSAITTASRYVPNDVISAGAQMTSVYNIDGQMDSATARMVGCYIKPNRAARVILYLANSVGATQVDVQIPANEWTWVNTNRRGTGHSILTVERADGTQVATTDEVLIAGCLGSQVSADRYFDGDTQDTPELTYSWFGTANNSMTVVTGLNPADWYQMNGGAVTRALEGGVNYRNGVTGTGAYMQSTSNATPGWFYSARFEIRRIPGEHTSGPVRAALWDGDSYIAEHNGTPTYFNTENLPIDGTPLTFYVNAIAPVDAAPQQLSLFFYADAGVKTAFHVDNVMIQEVEVVGLRVEEPYFDGDSESNAFVFDWSPTAYTTSSTKRELVSAAVPWNGMTSVEETSGDSAKAYFVDGRPFLYLPVPKEYKATLNAYMYPDAFSEMMGLAEITDGMYLDSQPGQAFDFSYRTLVGNAIQGTDHGYKIHLVYNATVTPGAMNYETLGESINPTTMSWEVQAVPTKVDGYRPTAHIIIDTRHMNPSKIKRIEDMLYGGDNDIPVMPDPQVIFDLLNYGDTIIVTNNGDGTFDVEGSYENVYLLNDGQFRLENIDGEIHADGTFTISTTEG